MNLKFEKLVGAGNDFIFVCESELPQEVDRSLFAREICDRNFGIGGDGLVIIEALNKSEKLFQWDFYNSDGSRAEMCGNAARCAVRFIKDTYDFSECTFETLAGPVAGRFLEGKVAVSWKLKSDQMAEVVVDLENFKTFKGFFLNTGVPHYVITNMAGEVSLEDCIEIQKHPQFGEAQTNVTLLEQRSDGLNETKTFERGVKNFTLACGTGVIACAFVLQNQKKLDVYKLEAPGGSLEVMLNGTHVTLIGPADTVFRGNYLLKEVNDV